MADAGSIMGAAKVTLILSAFGSKRDAMRAARALVRSRHLACATVSPGSRAFYRWKGRLRAEPSVILWGKTTRRCARDAMNALRRLHPDRVPEILALPVQGGHGPYLDWVLAEVKPPGSRR